MDQTIDAPRDTLFGLLAFQAGLIDEDSLVDAFRERARGGDRSSAEILVERGDIEPTHRDLVEGLVDAYGGSRGGGRGPIALKVDDSTRKRLAELDDPAVDATLSEIHRDATSRMAEATLHFGPAPAPVFGPAAPGGARFRVLRHHAKGGLGLVSVALDAELNREVALKEIQAYHADDATSRNRFLIEAEITGGLEHPGIVPVYGLGCYPDGRPYYAMRFIRGETLKEAIERHHAGGSTRADPGARSLDLRKLLRRFLDVCNAIDYAHGRGVIHRDIKPSNVIVGRHGETLVVDWGLAKASGRGAEAAGSDERPIAPSSSSGSAETLPGSAMGTPGYLGPEQAAGDLDRLGPTSDVYSLGATLYCLLAGKPPFEGDVLTILRATRQGDFPPPRSVDPTIDRPLEAICLKAMATRPEDRFASARALADDVERWMADEPVEARPEGPLRRLARFLRRHRAWTRAAAAALVLVSVVSVVAAVLVDGARRNERLARLAEGAALEQERAQRDRAEANFDLARRAVEDSLTKISENALLKLQDAEDVRGLRKELLSGALGFYREFIRLRGGDPALSAELADAYERLGAITGEIGSKAEALGLYRQALAIREAAVPLDARSKAALAGCLAAVGRLEEANGQPDAGLRDARRAVSLREEILNAGPDDALAIAGLAEALLDLASIVRLRRDPGSVDEDLALLERARDLDARPVGDGAASADSRSRRAKTLNRLGEVRRLQGRIDAAVASYGEARDLLASMTKERPDDLQARADLAGVLQRIGQIRSENGRPVEAAEALERARAVQEALVAAHPSVTRFQRDLADTLRLLGILATDAGRFDDARRSLEASHALRERLLAANPGVLDNKGELARSHTSLGFLANVAGPKGEGVRRFRQALALREEVAAADPASMQAQFDLAEAHYNVAVDLNRAGDPAEALRSYERARAIGADLVRDHPEVPQFQGELATTLKNIGMIHRKAGRMDEAFRQLDRAVEVREALVRSHPAVSRLRSELAFELVILASMRNDVGRHAEALPIAERSRDLVEGLVRDEPDELEHRIALGGAVLQVGVALDGLGRLADGAEACRKAMEAHRLAVARAPKLPRPRAFLDFDAQTLAPLLAKLGRIDELAALTEERRTLVADDVPGGLYDLACGLALCVPKADAANKPVVADMAMAELRRAVASGYKDAAHMATDADLDALKPRDDFRLLVLDLAFPPDPFAR